jgi:hypothetical protein
MDGWAGATGELALGLPGPLGSEGSLGDRVSSFGWDGLGGRAGAVGSVTGTLSIGLVGPVESEPSLGARLEGSLGSPGDLPSFVG